MLGKRFLFVLSRGVDAAAGTIEVLEQALTAAAFDQAVGLLFLDAGIEHLGPRSATAGEPRTPLIGALPHYDIQAIQVEAESLVAAGLTAAELAIEVDVVPRSEIPALLRASDVVVTD